MRKVLQVGQKGKTKLNPEDRPLTDSNFNSLSLSKNILFFTPYIEGPASARGLDI
jgi:hypothetical protein